MKKFYERDGELYTVEMFSRATGNKLATQSGLKKVKPSAEFPAVKTGDSSRRRTTND